MDASSRLLLEELRQNCAGAIDEAVHRWELTRRILCAHRVLRRAVDERGWTAFLEVESLMNQRGAGKTEVLIELLRKHLPRPPQPMAGKCDSELDGMRCAIVL